jgi:hypothetical protein
LLSRGASPTSGTATTQACTVVLGAGSCHDCQHQHHSTHMCSGPPLLGKAPPDFNLDGYSTNPAAQQFRNNLHVTMKGVLQGDLPNIRKKSPHRRALWCLCRQLSRLPTSAPQHSHVWRGLPFVGPARLDQHNRGQNKTSKTLDLTQDSRDPAQQTWLQPAGSHCPHIIDPTPPGSTSALLSVCLLARVLR